jgi:hypothetical protein
MKVHISRETEVHGGATEVHGRETEDHGGPLKSMGPLERNKASPPFGYITESI